MTPITFMVRRNSPLYPLVDDALVALTATGVMNKLITPDVNYNVYAIQQVMPNYFA